jgi:hypothetical protein
MASKSKWKRRLLWVSAFVGLCFVYVWFFGTQTFFALWARQIGRKIPIVKSVPVELNDLSVSEVRGERISFKGIEFEVPWNDVDEQKARVVGTWALIHFRSGNSIILCVAPADGFIAEITKSKTPDPELFRAMYGPDVLRSDYALHKAIFETTPRQINLFTPANRAAGLSSVIFIKAIMPPTTDWAIYNIRSQNFKGFQLGDPVRHPKKMCLELYGNDVHFEINMEQNANLSGRSITQPEINRIIQTVRKAPDPQSKISVSPL